MVPMSHMMVPIITLLGTLNFYLLFKFNIYKNIDSINITYDDTYITLMILMSHMMVSTITLLGTLNFYLLFKFNIFKKTK